MNGYQKNVAKSMLKDIERMIEQLKSIDSEAVKFAFDKDAQDITAKTEIVVGHLGTLATNIGVVISRKPVEEPEKR